MKYLKSLLVLPFLIALNVYADECSYKEQANLNKEGGTIEARRTFGRSILKRLIIGFSAIMAHHA